MRRLLSIATFVLALALAPVYAQHGGGSHGGGGGAAHSGAGFGGHVGGGGHSFSGSSGHAFGGGHSFSGRRSGPAFAGHGMGYRSSLRQPSLRGNSFAGNRFTGNRVAGNRFGDRFGRGRFRDRRFRSFGFRNCFGWNCGGYGWPGWYAGYYDPWLDSWWWDSHSSYDEDRASEMQAANEMNQESLEEQRARREEDQDLYARRDSGPQQREASRSEPPTPATVLVFRDQHKQEVQNYAIVGQTLWSFAASRTQKIPLSDLDLPSTVKANDDRGVDFRVPGASEGQ